MENASFPILRPWPCSFFKARPWKYTSASLVLRLLAKTGPAVLRRPIACVMGCCASYSRKALCAPSDRSYGMTSKATLPFFDPPTDAVP